MSYKLETINKIFKNIVFKFKTKQIYQKTTTIENFKSAIESKDELQAISLLNDLSFNPSFENDWALSKAATYNLHCLVEVLLKDERCKLTNCFILSNAILKNNIDIVKLLLADPRVDPTESVDSSCVSNYAIRVASENGYVDIVKLLLEDERVDPFDNYNYAIKYAYENGHIDIVELLWNDKRVKCTLQNDNLELYNTLITKDVKNKVNQF